MGFTVAQTYLSDILHVVSQSLLAPDIILLLAFIMYALFSIGSVVAEFFTERRHFKVVMPRFLAALMASKEEDIPQVIEHSSLLNRQKEALNTVYEYRALPGDALVALVRRLVGEEETRYDRITGRNNMAAKVSPMLGLMGTLIPLGPGIQALGTADTAALSSSLLVAFDTTVAGLVTAAICLVVGKIRSNWYNNYLSALDAAMATMMEKIEEGRETSTATLPEGAESYTFLFGGDEKKQEKVAEEAKVPEPQATAQAPAGEGVLFGATMVAGAAAAEGVAEQAGAAEAPAAEEQVEAAEPVEMDEAVEGQEAADADEPAELAEAKDAIEAFDATEPIAGLQDAELADATEQLEAIAETADSTERIAFGMTFEPASQDASDVAEADEAEAGDEAAAEEGSPSTEETERVFGYRFSTNAGADTQE